MRRAHSLPPVQCLLDLAPKRSKLKGLIEDHGPVLARLLPRLRITERRYEDDRHVELGVSEKVTTFTASDFGRTLSGNNDGSDHGWGSMHFVLGGAENGQRFYGTPPVVANNGPDDVGQGRLLPTTSVDQYAATLGRWLGISDTDLLALLPNLGNYNISTRTSGFV